MYLNFADFRQKEKTTLPFLLGKISSLSWRKKAETPHGFSPTLSDCHPSVIPHVETKNENSAKLTGGSAFFAPDSTERKLFNNPHAGERSDVRKTGKQKNKHTLTGGSNFNRFGGEKCQNEYCEARQFL